MDEQKKLQETIENELANIFVEIILEEMKKEERRESGIK